MKIISKLLILIFIIQVSNAIYGETYMGDYPLPGMTPVGYYDVESLHRPPANVIRSSNTDNAIVKAFENMEYSASSPSYPGWYGPFGHIGYPSFDSHLSHLY